MNDSVRKRQATLFCLSFFLRTVYEHLEQLDAAFRDVGAWSEDSNCTMIVQEFVILWRDNAADSYEDIFTAEFLRSSTIAGSRVL